MAIFSNILGKGSMFCLGTACEVLKITWSISYDSSTMPLCFQSGVEALAQSSPNINFVLMPVMSFGMST